MRQIVFLLLLLLLSSCASIRRNSHSEADISIRKELEAQTASHETDIAASSIIRWDSAWHDAILHFRIYDTSRYDSASGQSPVLMEGEMVSKGGEVSAESETDVVIEQKGDTLSLHQNDETGLHEEADSKSATSSSLSTNLVSLAIFSIAIWLLFRLSK